MCHYVLDKRSSNFAVRAYATGMLASMGHNPTFAIRDFDGDANLDTASPDKSSLRIQIRANSLEVTDEIKSKDRKEIESTMNEKVLQCEKYPTILFETTGAAAEQQGEGRYRFTMHGNLSLHGVTRSLPVTAQVAVFGDTLRAFGEFAILQSDFDIAPVSVAGGALKLKDQIKFTFDVVARKQE